jgi:hypothetical protein
MVGGKLFICRIVFTLILIILMIYKLVKDVFLTSGQSNSLYENLRINYWNLNKEKPFLTLIVLTLVVFMNIIKINEYIYTSIMIVLFFYLCVFHYRHCLIDIYGYTTPKEEDITNRENINIVGIGDIQNIYDLHLSNEEIFQKRKRMTGKYLDAINKLVGKLNNGDISNITLENEKDEIDLNFLKDKLVCLIQPGDCCQDNGDGRFFSINNLGHYEHSFNNNPEDGGLLNLPTYECLGNHDYDNNVDIEDVNYMNFFKWLMYLNDNPATNMINRRNRRRKYIENKDHEGNYSCNFGDLHTIFINVWPKREKLINGKPGRALDFLKEDLEKYGDKKWILITHFIEDNDNILEEDSEFSQLVNKYKNNCRGIFYGHRHNMETYITRRSDIKFVIMPGPAGFVPQSQKEENPTFNILNYNKTSGNLYLYQIKYIVSDDKYTIKKY